MNHFHSTLRRSAALALLAALPAAAQLERHALAVPAAPKGGYIVQEREPLTPYAQEVIARVNALRAAGAVCGGKAMAPAGPLDWSPALERAAAVQVRDMAQRGTVSHDGSDGSSVDTRIEREGYRWSAAGENAAAGNGTLAGTLTQWMGSAGHCSNLMSPSFREVAVVGLRMAGTRYDWYWIMVLATPRGGAH